MKQKYPEVLIITNKGGSYGMGHYQRVHLLKEHLARMNITGRIESGMNFCPESLDCGRVILLDSRDDAFPEEVLRQKNHRYLVAMDNRGVGRSQADIAWDTLPHPDMNLHELGRALRNCIVSPAIFHGRGMPVYGTILQCEPADIKSGAIHFDLVQYPPGQREAVPVDEFRQKLLNAQTVATYFGQTFFEALYLGKKIYLYDISEYHKKISDWFIGQIKRHPDIVNLLDGQGLHRLTALIRSILPAHRN